MALDKTRLDTTGSGSKGTKVPATYETTDNAAAVKTDGYFDAAYQEMNRVGAIIVFASDETFIAKVTVTTGDVDLAAMDAFA